MLPSSLEGQRRVVVTQSGDVMEQPFGPFDYDLLVIGGGSAGLAVAKEAARLQRRVLVINLATPSPKAAEWDAVRKLLHQASLLGKAIQDSRKYGWRFEETVSHDWCELAEAVRDQVRSRGLELRKELRDCGVIYLSARGEIVAPHTVEATDDNGRKTRHSAETLVIATGDRPRYLGVSGDRERCLTSDDLFSLPRSPGRTLVVGGSPEGLECAGFLSGLGSEVSVMLQPDLLAGFDQKMVQKIMNHMFVHDVSFVQHYSLAKVEQIEACSKDIVVGVPERSAGPVSPGRLRATMVSEEGHRKQEDFDTVLLAVGREPCTGDIGLESVGLKCSQDSGGIPVNDREQTSVDHIYAVGSVQHGRPSTTGLSTQAGALLARRLYGGDVTTCDYSSAPFVLFTPVEYAACGLSEERAKLTFGEASVEVYHSYYWPLEWTLPSRGKNSCYGKVICHVPDGERVVGLHVMGPNAGDIVQGFAAAMKCGLSKRQLDATVGINPVSAQVLTTLTLTQRVSEAMIVRGNC
ncbi:thioredoxin reductase 1, cytoplasmic-like [Lampris incognitus]|uniref:thioredoxin reductase 1, cytoplasmic-like n=1 Tax=Lampris incognitus TaxID=2546036 RepID=UPI0024B4C123|nr:thioredoxin reductase 1, cytoplasmic-like [Lampris incognitus]